MAAALRCVVVTGGGVDVEPIDGIVAGGISAVAEAGACKLPEGGAAMAAALFSSTEDFGMAVGSSRVSLGASAVSGGNLSSGSGPVDNEEEEEGKEGVGTSEDDVSLFASGRDDNCDRSWLSGSFPSACMKVNQATSPSTATVNNTSATIQRRSDSGLTGVPDAVGNLSREDRVLYVDDRTPRVSSAEVPVGAKAASLLAQPRQNIALSRFSLPHASQITVMQKLGRTR